MTGGGRVLVVDDERKIRELVAGYLAREGYAVTTAASGEAAIAAALRERPDLIVLDLLLPDVPGEEVARAVRRLAEVPIVMLTARSAEEDRVAGLRLGADDYLVKPFSVRELAARVEAVLRRAARRGPASYGGGSLLLDPASRSVTVDGSPVALTRTELDMLLALADGAGRVLTREQLIALGRGYGVESDDRTVDAHVKNLRRKLGDDPLRPRFVQTVPGVGYRFMLEADA